MSFEENNSRGLGLYIFMLIVVVTLPWWMPHCVTDPIAVCKVMCEKSQKRDFVDYSNSKFITECICGAKIKHP